VGPRNFAMCVFRKICKALSSEHPASHSARSSGLRHASAVSPSEARSSQCPRQLPRVTAASMHLPFGSTASCDVFLLPASRDMHTKAASADRVGNYDTAKGCFKLRRVSGSRPALHTSAEGTEDGARRMGVPSWQMMLSRVPACDFTSPLARMARIALSPLPPPSLFLKDGAGESLKGTA
jgi:hypothetical protein